jgi:hypothetical protein
MAVKRFKESSILVDKKYTSLLAGNDFYMPPSFESIATAVGTGSSGTITFSSIPSTYKHLQVRLTARVTGANIASSMRINNDTTGVYARHALFGTGANPVSAAGSASQTSISWIDFITGSNSTSGMQGVGIIDIADYASTTKTKTVRLLGGMDTNNGSDGGLITLQSGLYNSTTAITRLDFLAVASNWATTTTFSLYGIKG